MRVLIVDDERLARVRMRGLLSEHDVVRSIDEAASVAAAIEAVRRQPPDVVFLDIEMPGGSGFELLDHLPGAVSAVFVTAFDEYAVRAFEVNAVDYLLKPVDPRRLAKTLERLSAQAGPSPAPPRRLGAEDRLFLPRERSGRFVPLSTVVAIVAAGSYSEVRTVDGRNDLVHRTLEEWEERLPAIFRRVHRSTIVNLDQVVGTERLLTGGYRLRMKSGPPVVVSRRHAVVMRRLSLR